MLMIAGPPEDHHDCDPKQSQQRTRSRKVNEVRRTTVLRSKRDIGWTSIQEASPLPPQPGIEERRRGRLRVAGLLYSAIARAHGLNTNLVHGWLRWAAAAGKAESLTVVGEFVA